MPQMMPMMWLWINIFIFLMFFSVSMKLMYFLFMNYKDSFNLTYNNKLNVYMMWSWKW
uniref:ATP synthase F0 subunit 8 n=1 Tax=Pachycondyla annamita TaxID=613577 RepID=UPI002551CEA1|nr:ATP synthase F0 subunit 8 [Pachycondyla annamita]WGF22856.1 ATP synthase F0 subunit 8 [Pachycondyla annamita]